MFSEFGMRFIQVRFYIENLHCGNIHGISSKIYIRSEILIYIYIVFNYTYAFMFTCISVYTYGYIAVIKRNTNVTN